VKLEDPDAKQVLIRRLRRIEGQVRGVQSMVEQERDCQEILQQLAAIRSAVQGASLTFLEQYVSGCLLEDVEGEDRGQRERLAHDLITLLGKAP
jgi:DNA-binding FrmR family transcriptional regulator